MSSQYLRVQSEGGVCEARILCEKVAEREAQVLMGELTALGQSNRWRVIVDMQDTMMLASVGLGTIVTLNKAFQGSGGRLVLFNIQPEITAVLKLTKLDKLLAIADSRDAAVARLPA